MAITEKCDGQTNFGSTKVGEAAAGGGQPERGGCAIGVLTGASSSSAIILQQLDGTEKVIWVDNTGDLRIGTRANWNADTGGAVVGSQS